MQRTRRTDPADTVKTTVLVLKTTPPLGTHDAYSESTDKQPALLLKPNTSLSFSTQRSESVPNEGQPKENTQPVHSGTVGDGVKLPVGPKTSQLVLTNEEDMVPVVAFKERRSLRTLTGLEEIQTHQRAGEGWDPRRSNWKLL